MHFMNEIKIVTHNGKFHPDDVFAVATIYSFLEHSDFPAWRNKNIHIIRTRDEAAFGEGDFVVDVGGIYDEENNKFDHHQEDGAGVRANGIPYASFGLVWKKFGEKLCGSKIVAEMVDAKLVQIIDANDNGINLFNPILEEVEPYTIGSFIFSFLPTWKESPESFDTTFHDLVGVAQALIKREIKRTQAKLEAAALVMAAYEKADDKRIVVLEQYLPWQDIIVEKDEPLFVVYPRSEDGKWSISAVPIKKGQTFINRKDLPPSWGGKRNEELVEITGVADALFCHNGLFLAVSISKEGALALAKLAISA